MMMMMMMMIWYRLRRVSLVLCARSEDKLLEVEQQCRANGARDVLSLTCDVTREQDCKRVVDACIEKFGHLDVLLLNAGISGSIRFDKIEDLSLFERMMQCNFFGYLYFTHHAMPHLKQRAHDGHTTRIGVVSSMSGKLGIPYRSAYCSSKYAVQGLFSVLQNELPKDSRLHITLLCPGWIDTDIRSRHLVESQKSYEKRSMLSVDDCVQQSLYAIATGQRETRFGLLYRIQPLLQAVVPSLVDRIVSKKTGIDVELEKERQLQSKM